MKNVEQIEEEHIKKLAFGLNRLGIEVDLSNEGDYVACRDILEAAVSYAPGTYKRECERIYRTIRYSILLKGM